MGLHSIRKATWKWNCLSNFKISWSGVLKKRCTSSNLCLQALLSSLPLLPLIRRLACWAWESETSSTLHLKQKGGSKRRRPLTSGIIDLDKWVWVASFSPVGVEEISLYPFLLSFHICQRKKALEAIKALWRSRLNRMALIPVKASSLVQITRHLFLSFPESTKKESRTDIPRISSSRLFI